MIYSVDRTMRSINGSSRLGLQTETHDSTCTHSLINTHTHTHGVYYLIQLYFMPSARVNTIQRERSSHQITEYCGYGRDIFFKSAKPIMHR